MTLKTINTNKMKNEYITLGWVFGAGIGLCIGILTNSIAIDLSLGSWCWVNPWRSSWNWS